MTSMTELKTKYVDQAGRVVKALRSSEQQLGPVCKYLVIMGFINVWFAILSMRMLLSSEAPDRILLSAFAMGFFVSLCTLAMSVYVHRGVGRRQRQRLEKTLEDFSSQDYDDEKSMRNAFATSMLLMDKASENTALIFNCRKEWRRDFALNGCVFSVSFMMASYVLGDPYSPWIVLGGFLFGYFAMRAAYVLLLDAIAKKVLPQQ